MRKRERYEGVRWFNGWLGDADLSWYAPEPTIKDGLASLLSLLVCQAGLYVDMERRGAHWVVRVSERHPKGAAFPFRWAFSYTGADLRNILAAAYEEYCVLQSQHGSAHHSKLEVCRWVIG